MSESIDALKARRLRTEVERLRRERDEARRLAERLGTVLAVKGYCSPIEYPWRERVHEVFVGTTRYAGAKCVPPSMRETVPLEDVVRWGKGRCQGDSAGWLVGELASGRRLWGRVKWQDSPLYPVLRNVRRHPTPQTPGIGWIDRDPQG